MERFLTYGISEGNMKHISQVENGLACGCVCPNCGHPLVAKNTLTNKRAAHFAHKSGKECEGAIESALHLLAKAILQKTRQITIPHYHYDYNPYNPESLFREGRNLIFDEIILEEPLVVGAAKIIPDAIAEIKAKRIIIEFANTHFVDAEKRVKIKKAGIACIEIDLREQALDEAALTEFLSTFNNSIYWISNPRLDQEYSAYWQKIMESRRLHEQQEQQEEDTQNKEVETRYKKYKNHRDYRLLVVKDGRVTNCPLKKETLNQLQSSPLARHEVIKRIINGEYWNGELYGYEPNGKWIYLKEEKVIVYPADSMRPRLTERDNKQNSLLFAGLSKIRDMFENPAIGRCGQCQFSVDHFVYEDKGYEVCKHSMK